MRYPYHQNNKYKIKNNNDKRNPIYNLHIKKEILNKI